MEINSLTVGSVMGIASAAIQITAGQELNMQAFVVPIASAIIGGAMSYAVLRSTVSRMEQDFRDMRKDMGEMYTLLRQALTQVAHLEGRLERSE
jgi:hypothetical protein